MEGEEFRTGSADSENGSDNSYVHVQAAQEEAQHAPAAPRIPAVDDEEDIYGAEEGTPTHEEQPPQPEEKPQVPDDPYYVESRDPEEESTKLPPPKVVPTSEPLPSSGVEDVDVQAGTEPFHSTKAKGYLKFLNVLHPFALFVIYWNDVKLSAVILGVCLVVLLTLTLNTFLHTIVLLLLSFLVVSLCYIVTKVVIDSFYNREIKNPFSDYLNQKITLPEKEIVEWTQFAVGRLNCYFNILIRLLLFDNIKASLKFGVALWLLSFVTNCLNILTALFLLVILLFLIPPLYDRFQSQIDCHVDEVVSKGMKLFDKVRSSIPYLGKSKVD